MGRAVVQVAARVTEQWVRRTLPPDHRIVAVCPVDRQIDYLIEGPSLPEAATPPIYTPIFTMHLVADGVRLTGQWSDGGEPWIIGTWESMDAFCAERERLL